MAESHNRFYSGDVSEADMLEVPRRHSDNGIGRVFRVIFVCVAVVGLGAVLIYGSQPQLTPEQIVQSETYEGEQEARRIFNLYSLKQDRARREVAAEATRANARQPVVETAVAAVPPVQKSPSLLPESTIAVVQPKQPVVAPAEIPAMTRSYEKAELSRGAAPVIISKVQPQKEATVAEPQAESVQSELKMLPVYPLSRSNVVLRESPSDAARSVAVLDASTRVTLFTVDGNWAQVATNDGSGKTGYVRKSALGADLEQ